MTISEFSIPFKYKTWRTSPIRWVAGHALHHWPIFLIAALGAIGNAALASVPAVQFGKVFSNLTSGQPLVEVFCAEPPSSASRKHPAAHAVHAQLWL